MRIEDESCIYRIMTTEVSQDAEIRDGRGRDGETRYNKDFQIEEEEIIETNGEDVRKKDPYGFHLLNE